MLVPMCHIANKTLATNSSQQNNRNKWLIYSSSSDVSTFLTQLWALWLNVPCVAEWRSTTLLAWVLYTGVSNKMIGSIAVQQIACVCVCVCVRAREFSHPSIHSWIAAYSALRLHQLRRPTVGEGLQTNIDTQHAETQGEWLIEWNPRVVFESKASDNNSSGCQASKQTQSPSTKLQG